MSEDPIANLVRGTLIIVPAIWLGMLVGVSLIATPVKFTAPILTYDAALDVGRVTFTLFNKVEWVMAAALALVLILSRFGTLGRVIWAGLVACLAAQSLWLLPVLNERVAAVIAGAPLPISHHHKVYVAIEGTKFLLLIALIVSATIRQKNGN